MLLGPEGTSSPLTPSAWGVLVSSAPGVGLVLTSVFGFEDVWWVLFRVCGLVGVCELDSGCEHLVVLSCQTGQEVSSCRLVAIDVGCE
jgi:hypothetical protein